MWIFLVKNMFSFYFEICDTQKKKKTKNDMKKKKNVKCKWFSVCLIFDHSHVWYSFYSTLFNQSIKYERYTMGEYNNFSRTLSFVLFSFVLTNA